MKADAKYRIAAGRTVGTIEGYVRRIGHFLTFFVPRYPHTQARHALTMQDIDAFIVQLKGDAQRLKLKNSNTSVSYHIQALFGWLSYLLWLNTETCGVARNASRAGSVRSWWALF